MSRNGAWGFGVMAQVNVTINGRQFRMACEDGQEGHLIELARDLDMRISGLRGKFGEIGDTRLTVMAALTVADELAEAGHRLKRLEEELAALQDARVLTSDRNRPPKPRSRRRLAPPPSASKASPRSSIRRSATATCRSASFTVLARAGCGR